MNDKQKKPALLFAEEETTDRKCKECVRHTEDGCTAWECEYINREEAIEGYQNWQNFLAIRCETCEHYGERTDDKMNTHAVCWDITEKRPRRDPDDFCSYWQRKEAAK